MSVEAKVISIYSNSCFNLDNIVYILFDFKTKQMYNTWLLQVWMLL